MSDLAFGPKSNISARAGEPDYWDHIQTEFGWSERELTVVRGLAAGQTRKRVAHLHGISKSTLQTYLQRAYAKAEVDSIARLVWRIAELWTIRRMLHLSRSSSNSNEGRSSLRRRKVDVEA